MMNSEDMQTFLNRLFNNYEEFRNCCKNCKERRKKEGKKND